MKIEYWKGRLLSELTKEELISALQEMRDMVEIFIVESEKIEARSNNYLRAAGIGAEDKPKYFVYVGKEHSEIVYVGTTTQRPGDRFRHHFANGKKFDFEVVKQYNDEKSMLDEEFRLIEKHNPKYNKIKHRKQNLNKKLSPDQVNARKGDKEWCQCCLKRRVNKGYEFCMWCS